MPGAQGFQPTVGRREGPGVSLPLNCYKLLQEMTSPCRLINDGDLGSVLKPQFTLPLFVLYLYTLGMCSISVEQMSILGVKQ